MALTLKVNEQRVQELPFEVYRKSGSDPDAQARFIAHFAVHDSGEYLTPAEAMAELDKLSMGEVNDLVVGLRQAADEVAAPKA